MTLEFTPHPIVTPPSDKELLWLLENDPDEYMRLRQLHEDRILLAEDDPVYNGFSLPQQEMVEKMLAERTECWVFGGNRSGKSFNSARMVMRALLENPGTTIICWSQYQVASIEMQQPNLY